MSQISATPPQSSSPLSSFLQVMQRQFAFAWRRTFQRGDWLALVIVLGLLSMPIFALSTSEFAEGMLIMLPITVVGILMSFLLSRSQFFEIAALFLYTGYGIITVFGIHALALPSNEGPTGRIEELVRRINDWFVTVNAGGFSDDNLIFVIFLSILYWFLTLNTVWHIFRLNRVWLAIIPPGMVLISTITNYLGDGPIEWYLAGFLFFSIVLIAHSNIKEKEYEWFRTQTRYPRHIRDYVLRIGAIMALLVMTVAWVVPAGQDNDNWEQFQEFIGEDPFEQLSDLWNRLFPNLEGQGIATADYYGGDRLDLSGPIQLGDDPVMSVSLDQNLGNTRLYWRSTVFDTYSNGTWIHRRSVRAFRNSDGMQFEIGNNDEQRIISQTFELDIPATSLVYAAPQPIVMGLPVEAELNCIDGTTNCINEQTLTDVSVVRSREVLRAGDSYTVSSSISTADATQLRGASTVYPAWVTDTYLQGGTELSPTIQSLTQSVVTQFNASNPYDKAKAIETWLRTNIAYNELIPPPPSDQDPLEWFIFQQQEGYCNYFATAMVMMLRSEGIPARMSAGFAQGEYDPANNTYNVIERDAHTWVEVFFPDYGWVNFEPTPDEPQPQRDGDTPFNPDQFPTITPAPTVTPTPFPTNTPPPPTPESQVISPTPTEAVNTPPPGVTLTPTTTPTPTITPTLEPTLSPTPNEEVVVPLQDVETDDDSGSFWDILLIILAVIFIPLLIITVIGLFTVWWVEYRGLGGLTPVQKAYARMGIYGRWLGADINDLSTPEEQRRRLVDEVPEGEPPINTISGLYTEERFAPPRSDDAAKLRRKSVANQSWAQARIKFIKEKFGRWFGRQ